MISPKLSDVLRLYFTKSEALASHLDTLEKGELIHCLLELLVVYSQDKNSSTLREFITLLLAGCKPTLGKLGFNGVRGSEVVEVKPRNVDRTKEPKRKLNGGGNFTDFTYERFEKYMKANVRILVSGFVDGKLVYILELPFTCEEFSRHLKSQLEKFYSKGVHETGRYLRGANFNYRHYKDCPELRLVYINWEYANKSRDMIVSRFLQFLDKFRQTAQEGA